MNPMLTFRDKATIVIYDISRAKKDTTVKSVSIAILTVDFCIASSIHGVLDTFSCANFCAAESNLNVRFDAFLVSPLGKSVRSFNGTLVDVSLSLSDAEAADVVVVAPPMPPTFDADHIDVILRKLLSLNSWLIEQAKRGTILASCCTGSFILAEAGLLNGKISTTHWRAAHAFRSRYPEVVLREEELVTEDGALLCGGGAVSYIDLTLHLIRKFGGAELAAQCASILVVDPNRDRQSPYAQFNVARNHGDELIAEVQAYIEQNYWMNLEINKLSMRFNLGERTLKRRFSKACGLPIGQYVQKLRISAAKDRLANSDRSFQAIVLDVGYEDLSSFARTFKRQTGLTMGSYRERFHS